MTLNLKLNNLKNYSTYREICSYKGKGTERTVLSIFEAADLSDPIPQYRGKETQRTLLSILKEAALLVLYHHQWDFIRPHKSELLLQD